MLLFKAIILVCSATVSMPDCQRDTALDVVTIREPLSAQQCAFQGQTKIASGQMAPDGQTYAKVICRPTNAPPEKGR